MWLGTAAYGIGGSPLRVRKLATALELSFVVSSQALRDAGKILVKAPFMVSAFSDEIAITGSPGLMPNDFTATGVVLLASSDKTADLAIVATNFSAGTTVTGGRKRRASQ